MCARVAHAKWRARLNVLCSTQLQIIHFIVPWLKSIGTIVPTKYGFVLSLYGSVNISKSTKSIFHSTASLLPLGSSSTIPPGPTENYPIVFDGRNSNGAFTCPSCISGAHEIDPMVINTISEN